MIDVGAGFGIGASRSGLTELDWRNGIHGN